MRPARLLAPAALVAAAVALFVVVSSGSEKETAEPSATPAATASATATPRRDRDEGSGSGGAYTVKPGDTPSGIAEKEDVDLQELLKANPDIDPDALTVGEELTLP